MREQNSYSYYTKYRLISLGDTMNYIVNIDGSITRTSIPTSTFNQRLEEKYPTSLDTELEYNKSLTYDEHKLVD